MKENPVTLFKTESVQQNSIQAGQGRAGEIIPFSGSGPGTGKEEI
jgi:hypothetical protein